MELIITRTRKVRDGEIIVQEDTWPYYAYVLKEGKARVFKNVDGKQVLIGLLAEGDIFGEIDFLGKTKRTVSVIADGDVTVEMITRDTFMDFVAKLPRNVRIKLCAMASDLTSMTEIYSRLVVLLQNMNVEKKMITAETFETEVKKIPEFMRHVITEMDRRHSVAVEGLNRLSSQLEKKQSRLLSN
ncbi:MAG: cyclic nucleotide-binding domain-containing protein [wastewater metagenome]|nr:cyclic nucleotide-binding domain-containing protein [Candidatus Loosdrechtia aerotolerans]